MRPYEFSSDAHMPVLSIANKPGRVWILWNLFVVLIEFPMSLAISQTKKSKGGALYINGRVGLILLASLGINLLLGFCLVWQIGNNATLANRRTTLVQLQNGDATLAEAKNANHREPEVILETAKMWLEMTYGKSSVLPNGKRDLGIRISGSSQRKVPTPTYRASYLLPQGYRTVFLEEFAAKFIPDRYFEGRGNYTSIVRIWDAYIVPEGNPEDGWNVEIIATVIDLIGDREVRETPVSLSLTLQSVVPNVRPYGGNDPSELRQAIADLREAGLAITSIEPLKL